jgi:hypothetical protein
MAKTGDIYNAVDELKTLAADAFTGIENDDDLDALVEELIAVRDKASTIIGVAAAVGEALDGLAKK